MLENSEPRLFVLLCCVDYRGRKLKLKFMFVKLKEKKECVLYRSTTVEAVDLHKICTD